MHRIPYEKLTIFKKWSPWMWSLARTEQFSFQIKSRTSQQTWNRLRALKLCYSPPVLHGVIDNSGNPSLNGQQFQTHCTDTINSSPKFDPLAQNSFRYCPNFVCHFFISFFEDRNFGVNSDKTLVGPLTFKCKE